MASQVGVTGICAVGIGIIALDNLARSKDPFPQLLAGGLFATGCAVVSEVDTGLATALATVFLVSALLLHSQGITAAINKFSKQNPVPTKTSKKGS